MTGPRKTDAAGRIRRRRRAILLCWLALAACGPSGEGAEGRSRGGGREWRGVALPDPSRAPDFTLTDTRGRPFDFRRETAGQVTLLFFGYTHCPDICPVHLANIAAVLDDMPYGDRRAVKVVFVTTDPERDTPDRLREWLDNFDRSFVGLRGPLETVNGIQTRLGLPPAVRQDTAPGRYLVGHASQVIALDREGMVRLVYPSGTRQVDWAHDLPKLVAAGSGPG